VKIGLLGYGTVGRSVAELLRERPCGIEVKTVLRRPGKGHAPGMTERFEDLLEDPEITCIAECLPGRDPALGMIRAALSSGRHVVTSNKAALAADFAGLHALAERKGVKLLYEASCGGGMPWIEPLKKASRFDEIVSIEGILNGTVNFMIDRMENAGATFADALAEAQRLGFAEADPTADISGADLRSKSVIACSAAWRYAVPADFPVIGVELLTKEILDDLHAHGKCLRFMLTARRLGRRYAVGVAPRVLSEDAFEARVHGNFNCGRIRGDAVGRLFFCGQGAGGRPTADAVIQDLIALRDGTAQNLCLDQDLVYDPSLLTGTGYFSFGTVKDKTLAELIAEAKAKHSFLGFEPADTEQS
jgi:homoserine dehydrogenase